MLTQRISRLGLIVSVSLAGPAALSMNSSFAAEKVVAQKVKIINGEKYTFTKYISANGNVKTEILNNKGVAVNELAVPRARGSVVQEKLHKKLKQLAAIGVADEKLTVNIALDLGIDNVDETPESGSVEILDGLETASELNGKSIAVEKLKMISEKQLAARNIQGAQLAAKKAAKLAKWANSHGLGKASGIEEAIVRGRSSVTLTLSNTQLENLIQSNDNAIVGIELYEQDSDDIWDAMADTSITTSALPYTSTRGSGVGIYMTESGCANESRITNYDRLSGSETNHSRNVGAIIRTVSPDSYLYCRSGAVLPQVSDLAGTGGNAPIYIITRSNSSNDTTSYNTLDRDWDNFVYNYNIATFNSGGNTGNGTGNVRSPGKGLNLVTVGNYNDANDTIVSSSPFVDPQTGNDKPEVVAPGANITAGGFTMTGTSQATPHAAAFSADMMSSSTYLKNRPYLVKAKLLAGATDSISGGYDKTGLGGIDFASAQWSGYYQWYSGGNSSFNTFDQNDGSSDGYIEKKIYISSGWNNVRAVISWLNRGSYTYDHRNDAHPIGMDLDLKVYDPNGTYKGGSFSWDNPYERVNFNPTVSGYYTFKIKRYANRDTSSSLRLGMYVNYY